MVVLCDELYQSGGGGTRMIDASNKYLPSVVLVVMVFEYPSQTNGTIKTNFPRHSGKMIQNAV